MSERFGGSRLGAVASALLAVALAAAAAWLFWDSGARRNAVRAGDEAAQAARDSIVAILSYQPATAQQSLEAAANDRLTGRFLDDYAQLVKTVVVPEAVGKRITATATVPAAAVVSADAHHAVVLAYVDQTMAVGSAAPTQTNSAVRVTMDNLDGRWLISGFDPI
jgi:Mce-associated membrane protein